MDRRDPVTGQFVPSSASPEERFRASYRHGGPDECWPWLAGRTGGGYGALWVDGRQITAHIFAFVLAGGQRDGLDVHHTCRNRACVNPAHLEALSRGEHTLIDGPAGVNARKTHCLRGHALEGENLVLVPNVRNATLPPWRQCRECSRQRKRERRARGR
jgi:hypothetical protein